MCTLANHRSSDYNERNFLVTCNANSFIHIQFFFSQCKIKLTYERSQCKLNRSNPKSQARATPPPSSKWNQFEMHSLIIYIRIQESLRLKLFRVFPYCWISSNSPTVNKHKMENTNASHLSPVLAVGGEGDVLGAVEEAVGNAGFGTVGEDGVVGFHDLSSGSGGGNHENRDGAEVEQHERTILV
nr:hypothetical protein EUGRSUZ_K02397 [Ipomoea batatas]